MCKQLCQKTVVYIYTTRMQHIPKKGKTERKVTLLQKNLYSTHIESTVPKYYIFQCACTCMRAHAHTHTHTHQILVTTVSLLHPVSVHLKGTIQLTVFCSDCINCVFQLWSTPRIQLIRCCNPLKRVSLCPLLLKHREVSFECRTDLI
jgi:hypothetical protein